MKIKILQELEEGRRQRQKIRQKIKNGEVKVLERRFIISLPKNSDHKDHPTGQVKLFLTYNSSYLNHGHMFCWLISVLVGQPIQMTHYSNPHITCFQKFHTNRRYMIAILIVMCHLRMVSSWCHMCVGNSNRGIGAK